MKAIKVLISISLFISTYSMASTTFSLESVKGKTEFLAVGNPGFLKIHGKGSGPAGLLSVEKDILTGEIEIDLTKLDTGMSLRNTHMKDKYLEVKTYPKAKLIIDSYKLPVGWTLAAPELNSKKLKAMLEIHGQKKPVEVSYTIASTGKVNAEFEVKISDFGIMVPSFMGVTVADTVNVKIQSELQEKK